MSSSFNQDFIRVVRKNLAMKDRPLEELQSFAWYVVKRPEGYCDIISAASSPSSSDEAASWGPFTSQADAIARRVGLIRSGKCKPV